MERERFAVAYVQLGRVSLYFVLYPEAQLVLYHSLVACLIG
jgi:hypothetical protein